MSNSSLSSSPARSTISTTAIAGANGPSSLPVDDFHFPADLISIQDRKDEALVVLKSDLMSALAKEVKSLDEDNWMFDGHLDLVLTLYQKQVVFSTRIQKVQSITCPRQNNDRIL